ncbi:MAG: GtrA family protein [Clostridia bacterium]|nr:GtrA family protein [Clostridia bacterium]
MKKIIELFKKYKEIILYLIIGGLTTLVNILAYWIFATPLNLPTVLSNVLAWAVSVLFAYFTNKLFVFESKSFKPDIFLKEFALFVLSRVATGAIDSGIMYLFVDKLALTEYEMWIKVASNVIVIVLNYIFSKLIVFKKKQNEKRFVELINAEEKEYSDEN